MMDIRTEHLRTLAAVIDTGTLDAAARALRLTPSAVSQRITALERSAGRSNFQLVPGYRHTVCVSVNDEVVHG
ncbi:LysR family transcriptional regulator, partial [Clavibacter michiganensis]|uniref:LysR family transcriptional regulator n=1 Tax=Clavibacter michiganensis TaxID=28447 RepID=UPI002174E5F6